MEYRSPIKFPEVSQMTDPAWTGSVITHHYGPLDHLPLTVTLASAWNPYTVFRHLVPSLR